MAEKPSRAAPSLVLGLGDPVMDVCVDVSPGAGRRGAQPAEGAAQRRAAPRCAALPPVARCSAAAQRIGPRTSLSSLLPNAPTLPVTMTEFLVRIGAQPGGCSLVEPGQMAALTAAAAAHAVPAHVPGGSAANVLKGLAGVSGGRLRCQLVGMVGADATGARYMQQLQAHGVEAALLVRPHRMQLLFCCWAVAAARRQPAGWQ